MKIVVYAISKNEEKFANRFMDGVAGEADAVYVTDTGSTDKTVEILRARGAIVDQKSFDPWRFDVARNASLDAIPADVDVYVCIDLDEVPTPGWRAAVEKAFEGGAIDRLRYKYVWSHLPDGSDGLTYWAEKIHTRRFRWVKPVHEILKFTADHQERQHFCDGFTIHHYPDDSKSRSSYLPLLELAVKEEPACDRNSHYLGREYMYYGQHDQAIEELRRHLSLPSAVWKAERSASMRFISKCYHAKGDMQAAEDWAINACRESPTEREPWVHLGWLLHEVRDFAGAFWAMSRALAITTRPATYLCEPGSWGALPYDIGGVCAAHLGMYDKAYEWMKKSAELEFHDERIRNNFLWISRKVRQVDSGAGRPEAATAQAA